ncbi:MAG: DUF3368 domain-containing protein [Anaerolineales bacterium]
MIVVSNSTPLIGLSRIRHLHLLQELFGEILIPDGVYNETVRSASELPGAKLINAANWIKILLVEDKTGVEYLRLDLDNGEAEAIVLAQEQKADLVLIDETKARLAAHHLKIPFMGTVGVLILAKRAGKIESVRPLMDALRQQTFYLSDQIYHSVLHQVGE